MLILYKIEIFCLSLSPVVNVITSSNVVDHLCYSLHIMLHNPITHGAAVTLSKPIRDYYCSGRCWKQKVGLDTLQTAGERQLHPEDLGREEKFFHQHHAFIQMLVSKI